MTNTYRTNNPLGSSAPKDLYDNASNFDEAVNSNSPAFIDRFWKRRQTLAGMETAFEQFLIGSGFEYIGDYDIDGPLTISRPTQVFTKDGSTWRSGPGLALPYTTVNNWATDQPKFVIAGDNPLRADLASSDPAKGASLVYGASRHIADVAALRAGSGSLINGDRVNLDSYRSAYPGLGGGVVVWDAASVEADNGATVFKPTSVVTGRWKRPLLTPLTIAQCGAEPGVDCAPAIVLAYSLSLGVVFPAGVWTHSGVTTVPKASYVEFEPGASLISTTGASLAIRSEFKAPIQAIFSGPGIVVGLRVAYPEWWGALGNGTGDDKPAIQAAHDCIFVSGASVGGRASLKFSGPSYQVSSGIVVRPSADINLSIEGSGTIFSGTRIIPSSTFSGGVVVLHVKGSTGGTQPIADWRLTDIAIIGSASKGTAAIGLQVGSDDPLENLIGLQQNLVENVYVGNFQTCIKVVHCRMINWRRCSAWNDLATGAGNVGLYIQTLGGFTGDMRFENCQFVANTNSLNRGMVIEAGSGAYTGDQNHIAGIKFYACDFYLADIKVQLDVSNGSRLGDIWFIACRWDGNSTCDFLAKSNIATSLLENIHFVHNFFAGANLAGGLKQIDIQSTGGQVYEIFLTDNIIFQAQGHSVYVSDNGNTNKVQGVTVTGNTIRDNNNISGAAMQFKGQRITVSNNRADRVSGSFFQYFIQFDATSNYITGGFNMGAGISAAGPVNNLSGAAQYAVANNL